MSRIIVKNLPKKIKEDRVQELFGRRGTITDCSLKYTKDGVFRRFAFIGYKSEAEAVAAVTHFNNSFIDTAKLQVELAQDLSDANKPRAWSKYSADSSAFQRVTAKKNDTESDKAKTKQSDKLEKKVLKEKRKQDKLGELLGDLKEDPEFLEFLEVNRARSTKATWGNDDMNHGMINAQQDTAADVPDKDSAVESGNSDNEEMEVDSDSDNEDEISSKPPRPGSTKKAGGSSAKPSTALSDLDYLKSKVSKSGVFFDSSDSESNDDEDEVDDDEDDEEDEDAGSSDDDDSGQGQSEKQANELFKFVVKMKGIPSNVKEAQIRDFFRPISILAVRIPRNARGSKAHSVASVQFHSEKDLDLAMGRNKNFIGTNRIFLHKSIEKLASSRSTQPRPWEVKKADAEEQETIAESGRLYVRNLAYCVKEEDLETLFSKYGPLSEVHLPIDGYSKKVKGFAFITYMLPEHAVKAYADLDGKTLQGRIMHILPAKAKVTGDSQTPESTSFRKKKLADQKAKAGSSHNWNTLFLGSSAVADVMANKYGTSKSAVLDPASRESVGVRLALGETQVVSETRSFLTEHGVQLDAFSQAAAERSKTVILAKNLPAGTQATELEALFGKHGTLGRVIMPPHGLTAIIEFSEQTEAKAAFRNLAYTKFKHLPLYLEWAPMGVFTSPVPIRDTPVDEAPNDKEVKKEEVVEGSEEEESIPQEGCTLFVKNVNFDSTDESLQEVFAKCGKLRSASIARKKDAKKAGAMLSMGYGFVEYIKPDSAQKALKTLQHTMLDGHQLELKISHRTTASTSSTGKRKKQDQAKKQTSTKIVVRNVPFEAKQSEMRELFSVFGELKTVRLPKKLSGTGTHRGFGFVDFISKEDAKRAFNALCHSTHLYGRRLVLEWADEEDSVEELRSKTAQHYHQEPAEKKLKKQSLMDELKLSN